MVNVSTFCTDLLTAAASELVLKLGCGPYELIAAFLWTPFD